MNKIKFILIIFFILFAIVNCLGIFGYKDCKPLGQGFIRYENEY